MAVAVNCLNTKILQFGWFISGRMFSVLPAERRCVKFKTSLLALNKNYNFLTTYEVKLYYEQSEKEK